MVRKNASNAERDGQSCCRFPDRTRETAAIVQHGVERVHKTSISLSPMMSGGRILITSIAWPAIWVRMRCCWKSEVTSICAKSSRSTCGGASSPCGSEFPGLVKFDGDHQAHAAHFLDERVLPRAPRGGDQLRPVLAGAPTRFSSSITCKSRQAAGHGEVVAAEGGGMDDAAVEAG